jgi:hypothetical protein
MEVLLLLSLGSVEPRRRVQEAAMEALDPDDDSLRAEGGEPAVGRRHCCMFSVLFKFKFKFKLSQVKSSQVKSSHFFSN